jgi:hypothetical protein
MFSKSNISTFFRFPRPGFEPAFEVENFPEPFAFHSATSLVASDSARSIKNHSRGAVEFGFSLVQFFERNVDRAGDAFGLKIPRTSHVDDYQGSSPGYLRRQLVRLNGVGLFTIPKHKSQIM